MWADAKYTHLDEHTDFIKSLVDNPDIEKLLGDAVFEAVYRAARKLYTQHNATPTDNSFARPIAEAYSIA